MLQPQSCLTSAAVLNPAPLTTFPLLAPAKTPCLHCQDGLDSRTRDTKIELPAVANRTWLRLCLSCQVKNSGSVSKRRTGKPGRESQDCLKSCDTNNSEVRLLVRSLAARGFRARMSWQCRCPRPDPLRRASIQPSPKDCSHWSDSRLTSNSSLAGAQHRNEPLSFQAHG